MGEYHAQQYGGGNADEDPYSSQAPLVLDSKRIGVDYRFNCCKTGIVRLGIISIPLIFVKIICFPRLTHCEIFAVLTEEMYMVSIH